MTKARSAGLVLLLLSACIFVGLGEAFARSTPLGLLDFKVLYNGARCFVHHCDPYKVDELARFYDASGLGKPSDPPVIRHVVTEYVYLPTTFLVTGIFASLPWGIAHTLWTIVTCASFITSACVIWSISGKQRPVLAGLIVGFWLASSTAIFAGGNAVGLAISLCLIAAWCFVEERYTLGGVLCLTISLLLKPHDSGLVWLYFLLAGGAYRKRALQTLALTVFLGGTALVWASQISPHWVAEMKFNLSSISTHGGMNDPAPGSSVDRTAGLVIDLQSVLSIFRNEPRFYNSISYLVCGSLLLALSLKTLLLKSVPSDLAVWIALSAIAPLTMLVTYHKPYDAKLLLLMIPAAIRLWGFKPVGNLVLIFSATGIFCVSDIPLAIFDLLTKNLHPDTNSQSGKFLAVFITRPVPVFLLTISAFSVWLYVTCMSRESISQPDPDDMGEHAA
jgi:hypothetical protein